jgi:hypothetical protein
VTAATASSTAVEPFELGQADHPVAVGGAVEGDHLGQAGQLGAAVAELGDLLVVLGEDHAGAGVAQDVGDVGRWRGGVHGGGGGTGAEDAEVGQDPVEPGARRDPDPVLRLDAERQQPGGDGPHPLAHLAPVERLPAVADRVAERLPVRRGGDPVEHHPGHRRGSLAGDGDLIDHVTTPTSTGA